MNLSLPLVPMVHTLFAVFFYLLKIALLVFLRLDFLHKHELSLKVVGFFQYFRAKIELCFFSSKFQNQFYSFICYGLIFRPRCL